MNKKTIGILGGMGPQASIFFYDLLIKNSMKYHGAKRNGDFPHIVLSNIPVSDLISSKKDEEKTVKMVCDEALLLEKYGVDFIVMPCNTMHLYQEEIKKNINISFLSMIDLVVNEINSKKIKKIGLLGTKTTMSSGMYKNKLNEIGIKTISPDKKDFNLIVEKINKVISGNFEKKDKDFLITICESLKKQGAEGILLGCTELPLVLKKNDINIKLFSSLEILGEESCKRIYGK